MNIRQAHVYFSGSVQGVGFRYRCRFMAQNMFVLGWIRNLSDGRVEMLAEYFVHDGGSTQNWRVKGHAEDVFWKWVCSWGAVVRLPSDLGYEDGDYALPPINMTEHVVGITHQDAWSEGYLFAPDVISLSDQRTTRRATMAARVAKATAIPSAL